MIIDLHWNKEFAKEREGSVLNDDGSHKLYDCPAGYKTIGYGHNLEAHGLPDSMANELLSAGMITTQNECSRNVAGWDNLNAARKSVVLDMCFNMGWSKLSQFKRFLAALDSDDAEKWTTAALEMEDSRWFSQVGKRAEVLQDMMLSGNYP